MLFCSTQRGCYNTARLLNSPAYWFHSYAPSSKGVCCHHIPFLIHSSSNIDAYCTFIMAGEYVTPSASGSLVTQDTVISQHSHMHKVRTGQSSSMYPIDNAAQGRQREPKPGAEDNVQPRFELFLLADGEKKVTEEPDTRESSYHCVHDCPVSLARIPMKVVFEACHGELCLPTRCNNISLTY